jgi:glycolate oxidase iron-sulfur subunit
MLRNTDAGDRAAKVIGKCVHCGFCNSACPTFNLLGDERDSPRGRIYLMKQALEGNGLTRVTQQHLDRCLGCRACESSCPSGVEYHELLDIGRVYVDSKVARPWRERVLQRSVRAIVPHPRRFAALLGAARTFRALLPPALRRLTPPRVATVERPARQHARTMVELGGCVQPSIAPDTNAAAARVLDRLGISLLSAEAGCCGAVDYHLGDHDAGAALARRRIDAWCEALDGGAEAIVMTASGCGAFVAEYPGLFPHDPVYRARAMRVAAAARDIGQILAAEDLSVLPAVSGRIAMHVPCSLQHGGASPEPVYDVLTRLGVTVLPTDPEPACCGSAGSYSLTQPHIATELRSRKLAALTAVEPDAIVTANIGCQAYLAAASDRPVRHWVAYLDQLLEAAAADG